MRFMAVVGIVAGIAMLFFLVLGVGLFAAIHELDASSPKMAEFVKLLDQVGNLVYVMAAAFLLIALAALCQNFALYHAGDYFNLVARTDVADLDYLSQGLDKLRVFFKIQVLIAVIAVVVAFVTGLIIVAVIPHAH
jgi:hypothetical protein